MVAGGIFFLGGRPFLLSLPPPGQSVSPALTPSRSWAALLRPSITPCISSLFSSVCSASPPSSSS